MSGDCLAHLQLLLHLRLTPVLLEPNSKAPLVKWTSGWYPTATNLRRCTSVPAINWRLRCGEHLPIIDCDSEDTYLDFAAIHRLPPDCPLVETDRSYDIWVKPDFAELSRGLSECSFPQAWGSATLESDPTKLLSQLLDQLIALGQTAHQIRHALGGNGHRPEKISEVIQQLTEGGDHAH